MDEVIFYVPIYLEYPVHVSVVEFQELIISNKTKKHEEINDTLQILPDPKKFKETQLKYILEVFGPKSDEMSIIGTTKFRGKYLTKLYLYTLGSLNSKSAFFYPSRYSLFRPQQSIF